MRLSLRMFLSLTLVIAAILSLSGCKASTGSNSKENNTIKYSETTENNSIDENITSETVSQAHTVDPIPFDPLDYSTWFFPDRTDLPTPNDVSKIEMGMDWAEAISLIGKPQYEFRIFAEMSFFAVDDFVSGGRTKVYSKENSSEDDVKKPGFLPHISTVVYNLSDGTLFICEISKKKQPDSNSSSCNYVLSLEISDDVSQSSICAGRANWYSHDYSNCPTPEEFQAALKMTCEEAIKFLGRAHGTTHTHVFNLTYKLTDGRWGNICWNGNRFFEVHYVDFFKFLDPETGTQIDVLREDGKIKFRNYDTGEVIKTISEKDF